jgi:hypothetical protein
MRKTVPRRFNWPDNTLAVILSVFLSYLSSGFWRFAIQHGYTDRSPVPVRRPQKPTPFIPYIYTREELRRLLDGVTSYQKRWCKLEPVTLRGTPPGAVRCRSAHQRTDSSRVF